MKITKWLSTGEFGDVLGTTSKIVDTNDLIEWLDTMAAETDSLGEIVFQCDDGKYYLLALRAELLEVGDDVYIEDLLDQYDELGLS